MSALRVSFIFLFTLTFLIACTEDTDVSEKAQNTEELPKLNSKLFRSVQKNGFTLEVFKEMSENRVSGAVVFDADYLPKEYHFTVKKTPIAQFRKDASFPADSKAQLKWFATHEAKLLVERMETSKTEKPEEVISNKKVCFKQNISGKEYGFPLVKTYYLRFYQSKSAFISVISWTIEKEAAAFDKIAQYMGMKIRWGD